jgi:hypothetical protein
MASKAKRIVLVAHAMSAVVLALSFFLPVAESTTYLGSDGRPVGLLGQVFPSPDFATATSYSFFWEDANWVVPVVFFVPALLVVARVSRATPRSLVVLDLAAPPAAAFLLLPLLAMVSAANLGVVPGMRGERAFGAYLALGALACFLTAATVLAATTVWRMTRSGREVQRHANPVTYLVAGV